MITKVYLVKVWVGEGWQRVTIEYKVLAYNEQRAKELVTHYWLNKNSSNTMRIIDVKELNEFVEGIIC